MENMAIWNALSTPPPSALKPITGGRLKGKSDINPQWRYLALTEQFGPCGDGWKFTIDKLWHEDGHGGEVFAFALVSLYVRYNDVWSDPIPGCGGSMLVEGESSGMHNSDEGYKMAITDALGTAAKMIGVAATVYLGQADSKYNRPAPPQPPRTTPAPVETGAASPVGDAVSGIIEQVAQKPTARGNTRYGLKVCGNWYNTFSDTLGATPKGAEVSFAFTRGQYGCDIVADTWAVAGAGSGNPVAEDNLPF